VKVGKKKAVNKLIFLKTELHPIDKTHNKFHRTSALVGARSFQPINKGPQ